VWVDTEHFDIRRHVLALDEGPLSQTRFDALSDTVLSRPLDRMHPLWEIHLAPRLEDGTVGLLMKIHHALVDGKSALAVALLLLDLDPQAPEPPAPDLRHAGSRPGAARLAVDALVDSGTEPLRALGRAARAAGSPRGLGGTLRRAAMAVGEDIARPAPSSFLNDPIGPRRTLVGHTLPVGELLTVKRAREASLNDVALAVVAGALRELALLRHVVPAPLKVMVPVSRRGAGEEAAMGNRIAFVFITLPVNVSDPLARLAAIRAETAAFKETGRAGGGEALLQGLGLLPLALQGPLARFAASPRMYNLVVSNVPGPRMPVYLLGAECVEVLPAIPLSDGHALSVGVFSLRDSLCFGAYADPEALPQARELPGAIAAAAADLIQASGVREPLRRVA
jgi:diacylglycerol O-acyltransferase / wax synthase